MFKNTSPGKEQSWPQGRLAEIVGRGVGSFAFSLRIHLSFSPCFLKGKESGRICPAFLPLPFPRRKHVDNSTEVAASITWADFPDVGAGKGEGYSLFLGLINPVPESGNLQTTHMTTVFKGIWSPVLEGKFLPGRSAAERRSYSCPGKGAELETNTLIIGRTLTNRFVLFMNCTLEEIMLSTMDGHFPKPGPQSELDFGSSGLWTLPLSCPPKNHWAHPVWVWVLGLPGSFGATPSTPDITRNWHGFVPDVPKSLPGYGDMSWSTANIWKWSFHVTSGQCQQYPAGAQTGSVWAQIFFLGVWFRVCQARKPNSKPGLTSLCPSLLNTNLLKCFIWSHSRELFILECNQIVDRTRIGKCKLTFGITGLLFYRFRLDLLNILSLE